MDVKNVFILPLLSFYQIRLWERKKYAILLHCGTAGKTYRAKKKFHSTIQAMFLFSSVRPDFERIEFSNAADFFVDRKENLNSFIISVLLSSLTYSLCDRYNVQIRP